MDLTSASTLRAEWCLYNSSLFASIVGVGLLGIIAKVVPTIMKLEPIVGRETGPQTPFKEYSFRRFIAIATGCLSILGGMAGAVTWGVLYLSAGAKSCDVPAGHHVPATPLITLYVLTIATLALFALHYFVAKAAERTVEECRAGGTRTF